jgi:hypothetical protein
LFTAAAVGRSVHKSGVSLLARSMPLESSAARQRGRLVLCSYSVGADEIAESTVYTLPTAAGARKELRSEVRIRAGQTRDEAQRVSGPWGLGYQLGDNEIFVVKGRHIFHMLYLTAPVANSVRTFAARAARKL